MKTNETMPSRSLAEDFNRRELNPKLSPFHIESLFETSTDGKISLFRFLDILITKETIKKEFRSVLYENHFNYFEGNILMTLKQLQDKFGRDRERFRQLREINLQDFNSHFAFTRLLHLNDEFEPNPRADFLEYNADEIHIINGQAATRFTGIFITKIAALLLKESHKLIGEESYPGNKRWNNLYLIKNELSERFKFQECIDFIRENSKVVTKRTEISFNDFFFEFSIGNLSPYQDRVIQICEKLMAHELGPNRFISGNVIFPRTKKMQVWEYVEDALRAMPIERLGHPVEDIYKKAVEQYPGMNYTVASLQSAMKHPLFIHFGKTSCFGLKEWEETGKVKGGTIQEMVIEYLGSKQTPVHKLELADYIQPFRDTDITTLNSNLESRKNDRFQEFKGGYWGLNGKEYPSDWEDYETVPSVSFTWSSMKASENLPFEEFKKKLALHPKNIPQIEAVLREKLANGHIEIGDQGELVVNTWDDHRTEKQRRISVEPPIAIEPQLGGKVYETLELRIESSQELQEQESISKLVIDMSDADIRVALANIEENKAKKIEFKHSAYSRNAYIILLIKKLRGYQCQICPSQIIKKDGSFYIEAAHITAKKFNGEESLKNIIILCPNCHKTFDFGDLKIIERSSKHLRFLLNGTLHEIDLYISDKVLT